LTTVVIWKQALHATAIGRRQRRAIIGISTRCLRIAGRTTIFLIPLNRALSKLGILSRAQATEAIRAGRVAVDGRIERNPLRLVGPERARLTLDGARRVRQAWRTLVFHKPRGIVTTRRDPEGRPTIYDTLGDAGRGLIPVGRLDLASSGLLLLTNDTQLANRLTDPVNAVPRVYVVTVRGQVTPDLVERLARGIVERGERLQAAAVTLRKASRRESHLTIELREGKNREVRRLFDSIGREVVRLKRVRFGGLEIGDLEPGEWRELSQEDILRLFG
jgi:23S rRNA pseudouridine2605 synthase